MAIINVTYPNEMKEDDLLKCVDVRDVGRWWQQNTTYLIHKNEHNKLYVIDSDGDKRYLSNLLHTNPIRFIHIPTEPLTDMTVISNTDELYCTYSELGFWTTGKHYKLKPNRGGRFCAIDDEGDWHTIHRLSEYRHRVKFVVLKKMDDTEEPEEPEQKTVDTPENATEEHLSAPITIDVEKLIKHIKTPNMSKEGILRYLEGYLHASQNKLG